MAENKTDLKGLGAASADTDEPVIEPHFDTPWVPVIRNPAIGYPTLLVAVGLAIFTWNQNASAGIVMPVFSALAVAALVFLAVIDGITFRLPDAIVLPLFCVALASGTLAATLGEIEWADLGRGLLCAFIGWFVFTVIAVFIGGMGFGDIKLITTLALILGFEGFHAGIGGAMLVPMLVAGLLAFPLILFRKHIKGVPMGPAFAISAILFLAFPGVGTQALMGQL